MCEMKILLNNNSILQVGIGPTTVALQSQLRACAATAFIKEEKRSVSAPFTVTVYRVKYFKPVWIYNILPSKAVVPNQWSADNQWSAEA